MPLSPMNRALRDFLKASEAADPAPCEDCLRFLLSGRAKFLNRPDPTRWRTGEIRELLLELAPTRLTEICDLSGHGVPAMRAYLEFLDSNDYLHPASAGASALTRELDRVASLYPDAMADRSRFGMAKRLYTAMLADGIAIEDDSAVNAWLETFHEGSADLKQAVLGELLEESPDLATAWFLADSGVVAALNQQPASADQVDDVGDEFPAVSLPDDATLAAQARSSATMQHVWEVAEWIAPRRTITKDAELLPKDVRALAESLQLKTPSFLKGRLQLRDVPGVSNPFWLALAAEVLAIRRNGVVPGPRQGFWARVWQNAELDSDAGQDLDLDLDAAVLEIWEEVFQLIVEHNGGPVNREPMAERLQDWARNVTPKMIASLYAVDAGRDVQDLIRGTLIEVGATGRDDEDGIILQQVLSGILGGDLIDLERHGAVRFSGPGLAEFSVERATLDAQGVVALAGMELADADGVTVDLTPLGTWALRRAFLTEGATAPLLALSLQA
jgi:hypothetical protein